MRLARRLPRRLPGFLVHEQPHGSIALPVLPSGDIHPPAGHRGDGDCHTGPDGAGPHRKGCPTAGGLAGGGGTVPSRAEGRGTAGATGRARSTGDALLPAGHRGVTYYVDFGSRTLTGTTSEAAGAGRFAENVEVLDRMMASVSASVRSSTCSADTGSSKPSPQAGLPPGVAATRASIVEAAAQCNYQELARLARAGGTPFTYSFGGGDDPAGYWQRLESNGEPVLSILATCSIAPSRPGPSARRRNTYGPPRTPMSDGATSPSENGRRCDRSTATTTSVGSSSSGVMRGTGWASPRVSGSSSWAVTDRAAANWRVVRLHPAVGAGAVGIVAVG